MAAPEDPNTKKKERAKKDLLSCLVSAAKEGRSPADLLKDYRELNGCQVPFAAFGLNCEMDVLRVMEKQGNISIRRGHYGPVIFARSVQGIEHIQKLVIGQKKGKLGRMGGAQQQSRRGRGRAAIASNNDLLDNVNLPPNVIGSGKHPTTDAFEPLEDEKVTKQGFVHIRIQKRTAGKTITTLQGLASDYDLKKIVRYLKKTCHCNGTVVEHPEYGEVIQLSGDQRQNIKEFICEVGIVEDENCKIHGF